MKRAYLLLLMMGISLAIPINGQSNEVPVLRYYFYNYEVTLKSNSSYEAIIPFYSHEKLDVEVIINQSLGNGLLRAFFFSDETLNLSKIPENVTFLYKIDGISYYQQPNHEIIAYREIPITGNGVDAFIVTTYWSFLNELGSNPDWKILLYYNGTETAKFDLILSDPNTVDIINYQELSLNSTSPTILDLVDRRVPMNLTVGLLGKTGLNTFLTVVWTTKNVTSEMGPEDFMTNPFSYDGYYSGNNSIAYNDSSGISLIRTINLTYEGETAFLDHPFFSAVVFRKSPYDFVYNWTTPLDATPFHLLLYAEVPVTIWIKLTRLRDNGFPTLLDNTYFETSSEQKSPFLSGGLVLSLFTATFVAVAKKRRKLFVAK